MPKRPDPRFPIPAPEKAEDYVLDLLGGTRPHGDDDAPQQAADVAPVERRKVALARKMPEGIGDELVILQQLGYGDDPLNQRASVGWKGMRAAERLVEQYMVRIESASSYSATAAAN